MPENIGMAVDRSVQIAALEDALNAGVKSVTFDGVTTVFQDADQMRKRIADLKREDDTNDYRQKPTIIYADLSGF